jgi:hypothetical protein
MGWQEMLAEQGFVPKGVTPKVYDPNTGGFNNQAEDPLSRLMQTLQAASIQNQAKTEKLQKDNDKKLDIYKTLREQGYDPKKAYEAAMKNVLPIEAPGQTMKEQTEAAGLERTKAETDKIKKGLVTKTKDEVENDIVGKVSRGEGLTAGEQKIYDDVIKKQKKSEGDSVDQILNNKNGSSAPPAREDLVAVYNPSGQPGYVPKAKLNAALAQGYRKR